MEQTEIQRIADYLKDLEEGLYEGDYSGLFERQKLAVRNRDSYN